jgi:hypothetical protein
MSESRTSGCLDSDRFRSTLMEQLLRIGNRIWAITCPLEIMKKQASNKVRSSEHPFDAAYRKYVKQERAKLARGFPLSDEMRESLWQQLNGANRVCSGNSLGGKLFKTGVR